MVANDNPFDVNDKIAVIRQRHGWHDGALTAIVTSRWQNQSGVWSYEAEVIGEDDSYSVEINHTRDARLIEKGTKLNKKRRRG